MNKSGKSTKKNKKIVKKYGAQNIHSGKLSAEKNLKEVSSDSYYFGGIKKFSINSITAYANSMG
jgi:hypothetical protein